MSDASNLPPNGLSYKQAGVDIIVAQGTEAGVPPAWRLLRDRPVQVPGLGAERHLLVLSHAGDDAPAP